MVVTDFRTFAANLVSASWMLASTETTIGFLGGPAKMTSIWSLHEDSQIEVEF